MLLIRANVAHPDMPGGPSPSAKRILKKVLVSLDGSVASEAVITYVMEIAQNLHMEVTFLQVISKTNHTYAKVEAYLQDLCHRFEDKGITTRYEVRVGAAADEIIDLADELASDMVATSTQGKSAINFWPLGSVAQKVLLGGNTPFLLIKA